MKENHQIKKIGRRMLTEPIIVSGKYFGIKLLSVYDFMLCMKMFEKLEKELISEGFDKKICSQISEKACIVSRCLYDSQNKRVFENGMEAIKNLTPYELKSIYGEYISLLKKILGNDKTANHILNYVKNTYVKNK